VVVAACLAAVSARAQQPTPTPERKGFEVLWERTIEMPADEDAAPWLATGGTAAFVAGAHVGLMAFNAAEDGAALWSSTHVSELPPVTAGDIVVTVADRSLVAVRQARDEVAWRADLDATPTRIVAMADRIAIIAGREIKTWDLHGAAGWHASLSGSPTTPVVAHAGIAYAGLDDGSLVAIDAATGIVRWRIPVESKLESLAVDGDRLYASAANGHLYSFESTRGAKIKWDYGKVRAIRAIGEPVADDRSVYFTLLDNVLYAFARGGGSERWHRALPNRPVTGPIVLDDSVIVALASGVLIEVRKDGRIRQPAAPPNLTLSPSLQSAVATADRRRVLTVTTTVDAKRRLTAWGAPPVK